MSDFGDFDWGSVQSDDTSGFTEVPDNTELELEVTEVEKRQTRSGDNALFLKFVSVGTQYKGVRFSECLNLWNTGPSAEMAKEIAARKLKSIFNAQGITTHPEHIDDVVGFRVKAVIGLDETKDKYRNNIKKFLSDKVAEYTPKKRAQLDVDDLDF